MILAAIVIPTVLSTLIHGQFIDPGHEPRYYAEHVQIAGPNCGIAGGSFFMFIVSDAFARRFERSMAMDNAVGVRAEYGAIDFTILAIGGLGGSALAFHAVSMLTKAATVIAGLSPGQRRTNPGERDKSSRDEFRRQAIDRSVRAEDHTIKIGIPLRTSSTKSTWAKTMPRVIHFEIHASDPAAIAKFYSALLGWNISKFEGMDYWLIDTGDKSRPGIDGGIVPRRSKPAESGQSVNAYVCVVDVESLDDSLEKALGLGATLALPKMPVPGVGALAYVKDPDGNILGMLEPERMPA